MELFESGFLTRTHSVSEMMNNKENIDYVMFCITRHISGDWGDLCEEDKAANENALKNEGRLFSSYEGLFKLWIITEADRSTTTVLLPSEY